MNGQVHPNIQMTSLRQRHAASIQEGDIEDPASNGESVILPTESYTPETRFKVFKGRHIQMMALGSPKLRLS